MLPIKNQLKGSRAFKKVKETGKMYQSDNFGFLMTRDKKDEPSRFGIIVSNKISKKAVDRNRVKRMLRAAIRQELENIEGGYNCLFLAKKGILDKDKDSLNKEVKEVFKKSKLL